MELLNNSIKAMPRGGTLIIRSFHRDNAVKIEISDTGVGISPERKEKIFTLFYSDTLTGLGFGLWWVKTFLQQCGGAIDIKSSPNKGAAFTISLPVPKGGLI